MVLGLPEVDHRAVEQLMHEAAWSRGAQEALPFERDDLHEDDGLGGSVMDVINLETEHVARQMERTDLPAAVGKQLGDADHTGDELMDIAGPLALGEDLGVAAEIHGHAGWKKGFRLASLRMGRERMRVP